MLDIFFICVLAKCVLQPIASQGFGVAYSFLTIKLRKSHIINYLITSLARSVRRKYQTSVLAVHCQDLCLIFSP